MDQKGAQRVIALIAPQFFFACWFDVLLQVVTFKEGSKWIIQEEAAGNIYQSWPRSVIEVLGKRTCAITAQACSTVTSTLIGLKAVLEKLFEFYVALQESTTMNFLLTCCADWRISCLTRNMLAVLYRADDWIR